MNDQPKPDLRHEITSRLEKLPSETLIKWLDSGQLHHNDFCRRAAKWRLQASALHAALEPFATIADAIEDKHFDRPGDGPPEYEPFPIRYQDAVNARIVFRQQRSDLDKNFKDVIKGVRIAVAALKKIEASGNADAAEAMAKIREIDPHV